MEPEKQTDVLYDFIYRDASRVTSLYAQIFGGRLSAIERLDQERKNVDRTGRAILAGIGGEIVSRAETQTSSKSVVDPHDLIVTDVLAQLSQDNKFNTDPATAPHGSLILAKGTLIFIDRTMLEIAVSAVEITVDAEKKKPARQRNQELIQGFTLIKSFLDKLPLPSAFSLYCSDQLIVAGTLKDAGMEEPISTYYFKHGTSGLSEVFLVGIKEVPSPTFSLPNTDLMGAGKEAAQYLSNMLFPESAIRVTPIAMFRKL